MHLPTDKLNCYLNEVSVASSPLSEYRVDEYEQIRFICEHNILWPIIEICSFIESRDKYLFADDKHK